MHISIMPSLSDTDSDDDDDEDLVQRSVKRARASDEKRDEELARALQVCVVVLHEREASNMCSGSRRAQRVYCWLAQR